jgi:hypothetical protein
MRIVPRRSLAVGCLGLATVLVGCQGASDLEESDTVVQRSALSTGLGLGGGGGGDSLTTYAARCEAATGIHVPTFDCRNGIETPQGTSFDEVEATASIPSTVFGQRTPPPPPAPPNPPANLVQSIQARGVGLPTGAGATSDEFFFAYQQHDATGRVESGAGTIEVKVTSLTTSAAKAGLMLRGSTAATAPYAMIAVTATQGLIFQSRLTVNGTATSNATLAGKAAPIWLRLMWDDVVGQSGKYRVAGAWSSDHVTWNTFGDVTFDGFNDPTTGFPFPAVGLMGLAVTSGNATVTATAGFDKFTTSRICDAPNVLNGQCDPRSKFQVLAQTADAIVVANCRKEGAIDDKNFKDTAVIQYNRKNGAICYYQAPPTTFDGSNVTAPSYGTGPGLFPWVSPAATLGVGCPACHDSGPFIRSPYIYQMSNFPQIVDGYDNYNTPLRYVGKDFQGIHSWHIHGKRADGTIDDTVLQPLSDQGGGVCSGCHALAVNDLGGTSAGSNGTGLHFDLVATADMGTQYAQKSKNPHSTGSPIWMRPGTTTFYAGAVDTVNNFVNCANVWGQDGYEYGPNTNATNCAFTLNGTDYGPSLLSTNDINIGTTGGSATGSLEFPTLNAPANTDVYGNSDNFFYTYAVQGGDGSAYVKVTGLADVNNPANTNPYAKAGIMVRDGSGAAAINVMIAVTAGQGATFQYRSAAGGSTSTAYLAGVKAPCTLRLTRSGRTWVGSVSTNNGDSWTQVGAPVTLVNLVTDYLGLVATSHNTTAARATFESFEWGPSTGWTLPSDPHVLVDGSIGGSTGGRVENKTVDSVTSKGGDIYGSADQFQYAFKTIGGDGVLTTKVTSQTATGGTIDPYAKAGLMIRETADPGSANVFVGRTPSGPEIQNRLTTGGATSVTNLTSPTSVPIWFRLLRTRNTFVGSMSTDGITWTQIGDPVVYTSFLASPLVGLAVSSHSASVVDTATFDSGLIPEPPGFQWTYTLPTWLDVGMGSAGSHQTTGTYPNYNEVVVGSGADIYNYSDQFFFAFKNVTGAATIIAQVVSIQPVAPATTVDPYAKAGIMFRDSATGGAPNAMMAITGGHGSTFQNRPTAGGNTPAPVFGTGAAPYWIKLVRSASNVYTGYASSNGTSWGSPVGSVTLSTIGQTALVGLAVTSHNASQSVKATFANVSITTP